MANHYIYNPVSFSIRAGLKKDREEISHHFTLDAANLPWQKVWLELIKARAILCDIMTPTVFVEHAYLKRPLVFAPESSSLISQLLDTKFDGVANALKVPHDFFSIAIPKDMRFNGLAVKGVFVSYLEVKELCALADNFHSDFKMSNNFFGVDDDKGNPSKHLCVTYEDPVGKGRVSVKLDSDQLNDILSNMTYENYQKVGVLKESQTLVYGLSEQDSRTQFEVLRFVASFIIYMSVHRNMITKVESVKMDGAEKAIPKMTLSTVPAFKNKGGVTAHYRNLRHAKYYQNDYADWPTGSRWVPVSMDLNEVLL